MCIAGGRSGRGAITAVFVVHQHVSVGRHTRTAKLGLPLLRVRFHLGEADQERQTSTWLWTDVLHCKMHRARNNGQ